jgi:hypothetical protein
VSAPFRFAVTDNIEREHHTVALATAFGRHMAEADWTADSRTIPYQIASTSAIECRQGPELFYVMPSLPHRSEHGMA